MELGRAVGAKYRLQRVLGVGGMGTVYEAVHEVTQRRVAVKVLHPARLQSSPNAARRFLKEARAAASIGHPGIADVLDAGQEEDGSLYLVLELLEGMDLEKALGQGAVTPLEAVRICKEVCAPLSAAHAAGIIHRDIKPANIFIAHVRGGRAIKLLDFGVVKSRDEGLTRHGTLVGTPDYMSPEQAEGIELDPRSDIFSLGATLFFCLSGRPPFRASLPFDLLRMIAQTDAPLLREVAPDVSPELALVVDKCLARKRSDRWSSAAELEAALSRCLDSPRKPSAAPMIASIAAVALAVAMAGAFVLRPARETAKSAPIEIPPVPPPMELAVEPAPPPPPAPPSPAPAPKPKQRTAKKPVPPKPEVRGPYEPISTYD